ncbi:MAG: hypothetical protein E7360_06620 [Clostridiales bacterium]|nr:hypothetical protein [Clostridiales bacterium]
MKKEKTKRKKKEKQPDRSLSAPSMLRRTYKTWVYNILALVLFSWLFFANYTIDELCYALDRFTMGDMTNLIDYACIFLSFWMWFRSLMRTINVARRTSDSIKHEKEVVENPTAKRAYEGVEGTGKTLNTANDVLMLAAEADRALRLRYYLMCPFAEELKDDPDFKVVKESVEYYNSHPDKLPHVMLNFKMKYEGREQYDFDMAYIDQNKRIAEGFVIGLTEAGNILPNSESRISKDPKKDKFNAKGKTEFLSLSRQFAALKMVYDEQRTGEVFLPLRSVTGQNWLLLERKKVLSPHFLIWLLDRVEDVILKREEKTGKLISKFYSKLSDLIEDIGFYVFKYTSKESIVNSVLSENNEFVIPTDIPFEFDTRGERYKYKLFGTSPQ